VPLIDRVLSLLVVEDHEEVRAALRNWLLTSLPPMRLREARSMDEALACAGQAKLDAGALAFVSKRELPHALLPLLDRLSA
jgi:CheY-like chemotaxis protein